ncbi:MAG TPA: hypothetical protein VKT33_09540 [Candidatus Angelobacter sp.]|nr:hypothetical protein [Candidatus Angelobacter sp.]
MARLIYSDESDGLFFDNPVDSHRSKLEPHHIVQLASAVLNATVVVIISLQKATSLVVKVIFWMAAIMLLGVAIRYTIRFVRWLIARIRINRIVAAETEKLAAVFKAFELFTDERQGESFRVILKNTSPYRVEVIDQIQMDYVTDWVVSLKEQLNYPAASPVAFFLRCREFSLLVRDFNTNYVIRAQKGILKSSAQLPESCLEQLETFREEYNSYLRDYTQWAKSLCDREKTVLGESQQTAMLFPCILVERIKSFRKTVEANA